MGVMNHPDDHNFDDHHMIATILFEIIRIFIYIYNYTLNGDIK